jgi:hypothetical protein
MQDSRYFGVDEDQSSGMLWNVDWSIDVDISEAPASSLFRVMQPTKKKVEEL